MPNWVNNRLDVSGDKAELDRFRHQAAKPYETRFCDMFPKEGGGWDYVPNVQTMEEDLSFWNFVRPEENILDEYFGDRQYVDIPMEERMKHPTNHWYDWNIRNWGCKWEARGDLVEDNEGELVYEFDTAWSPAVDAFTAMVEQFPALTLCLTYNEEQGWGGELVGQNGVVTETESWEIPDTHEERENRFGYCHCDHMDDDEVEYMYEDCPKRVAVEGANHSDFSPVS